ncbi:hypothetical protein CH289_05590 [Rhodococcus sp. RS1C4]|nr:oligosaccharide flippase family protein [Rhodococcus sp. RS1C4]OZC56195.1 hypothetical protein CH289_05590 [Rhodococcus sp. RS1C4]
MNKGLHLRSATGLRRIVRLLDAPVALTYSRILSALFGLATAPIVARALGPADRGYVAALLAVLAISPIILALGVPLAIRRRVSVTASPAGVVSSARVISAIASLPGIGVAFALVETLLRDLPFGVKVAFLCGMGILPLAISWMIDVNVLVARKKYLRVAVVQSVQAVVFFVGVVALSVFSCVSMLSVVVLNTVSVVLTCVVAIALNPMGWTSSPTELASLLGEGCRLVGSQAAEVATHRLDQVLVLPLIGAASAGQYAIAVTIAGLPIPVAHALGASRFSEMAKAAGRSKSMLEETVGSSIMVGLTLSIALGIASPFLIPIIFGPAFRASIPVALIALVGSVAVVGGYVCSLALAAENRGIAMTLCQLLGLATSVLLLFLLASDFGAIGAAIASSFGFVVTLFLLMRCLRLGVRTFAFDRAMLWAGIGMIFRK